MGKEIYKKLRKKKKQKKITLIHIDNPNIDNIIQRVGSRPFVIQNDSGYLHIWIHMDI